MYEHNQVLLLIDHYGIDFAPPLNAQLSRGGTPYSFTHTVGDSIPTITLPPVNVDSLLQADQLDTTLHPFRFGFSHGVSLNIANSGIWEVLPDGSRIWRLELISLNAYSMNLVFDNFSLNGDAGLFIYNPNHSVILGEFSENNNKPNGRFATQPLPGDTLVLELFEPEGHFGETALSIEKVVHAYYDILNESAWCEINVNCTDNYPWVANWSDQKRSVARLILQDSFCSGFLINDAANDPEFQYLLTAEHCLYYDPSDLEHCDPTDYVFQFNYENSDCNDQDVFPHHSVNGAQIIAFLPASNENTGSDFGLLQILEPIPDDYSVYYSGWTLNTSPANEAVGIHHPQGDVKKISRQYTSPIDYYIDWGWDVHWDDGTTEPGSSGSPLFNQDGYVIGQASFSPGTGEGEPGQHDPCNNFGRWIVYGRFDVSYDHFYPDPEHSLKPWLNPDNLDIAELNGRDWWQVFGCTDPYATNYDPNANTDDGSCECDILGDVNNDGFVDVFDLVILTDFIMGSQIPTNCQFWAGDVNNDDDLTVVDLNALVSFILNGEWPLGRYLTNREGNAIISVVNDRSLLRGDGEHLTLTLDTNEPVRAVHFELDMPDTDVEEITVADDIAFMTLASDFSSGNIEIIIYGQEGQSIPEGQHEICYIYFDDDLTRNYDQRDLFFQGVYVNDQKELLQLNYGQNNEQLIPAQFEILSTYPNPFNAVITMEIGIPLDGNIIVSIFDINGRKINSLSSEHYTAGIHKLRWEANDYPSGVYFVRAEYNKTVLTRKIILLK